MTVIELMLYEVNRDHVYKAVGVRTGRLQMYRYKELSSFLLPLAIFAGYHFSNHVVKNPIKIGIKLFTMISRFPNPALLSRKVQTAVSTYNNPHAAARI